MSNPVVTLSAGSPRRDLRCRQIESEVGEDLLDILPSDELAHAAKSGNYEIGKVSIFPSFTLYI